jgi:hypothetical protein
MKSAAPIVVATGILLAGCGGGGSSTTTANLDALDKTSESVLRLLQDSPDKCEEIRKNAADGRAGLAMRVGWDEARIYVQQHRSDYPPSLGDSADDVAQMYASACADTASQHDAEQLVEVLGGALPSTALPGSFTNKK